MAEGKTHFDNRRPLTASPGLPGDLYSGEVKSYEHAHIYSQPEVIDLIRSDDMPIPATEDRENYYDDRHIEYWLSGYVDWQKIRPYLSGTTGRARYLDFGGSTGRVSPFSSDAQQRSLVLASIATEDLVAGWRFLWSAGATFWHNRCTEASGGRQRTYQWRDARWTLGCDRRAHRRATEIHARLPLQSEIAMLTEPSQLIERGREKKD